MKKMTRADKEELLMQVMLSDLTPEEKAKKLECFKDDYEMDNFISLTFHDIYIAVLDNLGIEKYTGKSELLKHVSRVL
ncbi:hypothetical protein [uncultured Granulicatella sp.]|jgi:hypothetical protein|uniref:hypothetical protein n=1 Tax=uncultured Granulicatella sp. TaxID=316089 RepID=UPI0028E939FF|nr:hypothetical protein [uncultured Granulicatella sp.]